MPASRIGHYEIRTLLGRGGIGEVYGAFDTELERDVAIKTLRPELSLDKGFLDRFRSEATSLAKLNHPNITTLYALFKDNDAMCMVMELVHGHTLEEILQRVGRFPVRDSLAVVIQAVMGLRYAHRMGVIHRDIKPSNLMLTDSGTLKIMDFGIARIQGSQRLTQQGDVVGTLAYASPEQLRGHEGDGRSDLYSLATVLYELISGQLPFSATSDYELIRAQVETLPPPLGPMCLDIDPGIEQALMRALAKNPEERFDTVEDFGRALGASPMFADAPDIVREGVLRTYDSLEFPVPHIAGVPTDANPVISPRPTTIANPSVNAGVKLGNAVDHRQHAVSTAGLQSPPPAAPEAYSRTAAQPSTLSSAGRPNPVPARPRSRAIALGAAAVGLAIGTGLLFVTLTRQPSSPPPVSPPEVPQQIAVPEPPAQEQPINLPPIALVPTPPVTANPSTPPTGAGGSNPAMEHAKPDLEGTVSQVLDSAAVIVAGKIVNLSAIRGEDGKPAQAMQRYLKSKGNQLQCFARGKSFQCFANGEDIGERALRNGWARTRDGAPARYAAAEQEARRDRVGVWAM